MKNFFYITFLAASIFINYNRRVVYTPQDTIPKSKMEVQKKISPKGNTITVVFSTNMSCESCAKKIEENLSYMKGIKGLNVSLEKEEITVIYNPKKTNAEAFEKQIRKLGYQAEQIKK